MTLTEGSNSPLLLEINCVMIKKLLFILLAIFGFSFVLSGDTFAKDDITVPVSTSYTQICSSDSTFTEGFCGYNYFILSLDSPTSQVICRAYDSNGTQVGNQVERSIIQSTYFVINNITFGSVSYNSISCRIMSNKTGTFTLTDKQPTFPTGSISITENGTYDVTNYAAAVVNIPSETVISDLPPYSALVVDSFWKYHVAIAGGLASIFAIFVVYRIIKSRLR